MRRFISASASVMKSGIAAVKSVRFSQSAILVLSSVYVVSATLDGLRLLFFCRGQGHARVFHLILETARMRDLLRERAVYPDGEVRLARPLAEERVLARVVVRVTVVPHREPRLPEGEKRVYARQHHASGRARRTS